ncbi:alpha-amylase family glycosyl hydrolase [Neolewinella litorea]|uniref:T9SS type A sorting domain-containing protein n=1 Tax=Neolewinella litorea TaxID=2562452 RepID=A0A4S4NWC4_9BACT|nr:alpha-amylase family glycosyl hydrolase [Neolewinella litorea]THH40570.1 T9SS type A sorting domain-containing protein [Neolewinella litorea]
MLRHLLLLLFLWSGASVLHAQLVTTDPAAPVAGQPLTITFDATQGTAGLKDCNCAVYLHTGVITDGSTSSSDWKFVKTTWGEANPAWKLEPVAGQPNKFTYTFSPSIREYFGVPAGTEIKQIAMVFRDATGDREGKATGGADIFVDVNTGSSLAVNLVGDPGSATYPLGKTLSVTAGATTAATLQLYDNDSLLTTATGAELSYDVRLLTPGSHTLKVVASADGQEAADSFQIDGQLVVERFLPAEALVNSSPGTPVTISAFSYVDATLRLQREDEVIATVTSDRITEMVNLPDAPVTTYTVTATYRGETASTSVTFITGDPEVAAVPDDARPGATRTADGGVLLHLRAPQKSDVFVVGNFNDWTPVAASRMKVAPNDTSFWLKIPAEDLPEGDLLYQYAVDGDGRFADPYSTLVLDPDDDPFIGPETFAGIPDYPSADAEGIVTWLRLDAPEYSWETEEYTVPDPEKMVVYELLVRDFIAAHDFQTLTDTLDYLDRLGVNTIELMPVSEFEGNLSWGYNPSFHMALDKYYGSPEALKAFVDAAHARGMAVVLDVVYNHAFGESSLIRMWPGNQPFAPGADNPYANVTARHPFNVGYDLNHESALTQEYVKTTLQYWLEEFRIDGFRFDLSKGFTQNFSNDVGTWNRYDASRVAILKEYADLVWSVNEDAYMIMEHLGESREENELAQYGQGMYFWSGYQPHDAYLEAAMGYNAGNGSNFSSVLAENRGFDQRSLIAYMESHDEERMVYKNLQFGNGSGNYNVQELGTALDRVELASAFFYTLPGPKMLWQFGELGYDYPINYCTDGTVNNGCRTGPKPIVWEYRDNPARQDVYHTIADLLYVRNNFEYFHGEVTASNFAGEVKYVFLDSEDGPAAIVGNFGVTPATVTTAVPASGTWFDFFNQTEVQFDAANTSIDLGPGEYRVFLSQPVDRNGGRLTSTNDEAVARLAFTLSPNPTAGQLRTYFFLERPSTVSVTVIDLMGRPVRQLHSGFLPAGQQQLQTELSGLPAGTYFVRITEGRQSAVRPVIVR